ncbi:hypothetical protein ACFX15_002143 [Malus domestica]
MVDEGGELSIFFSNYEDIIVEILSWLPVISLLRFCCVCKLWRALISTSDFIAKHRGRTNHNDNNKNILIIFERPHHFRDPPSRFPQIVDYLSLKKKNVVSSVSASASAAAIRRDLEDEFPDDTSLNDSSVVGSFNGLICLLLEPPRDDCFYGFGYDSTTQDYKVLLGGFNSPEERILVAIFALKTGSWKIVSESYLQVSYINMRGCFLNGALHWTDMNSTNTGTTIRSFDFAQEKFRFFSLIKHKGCSMGTGVGTTGDRLFFHTSCIDHLNHPAGFTIWVMMEYGVDQSWTILAKIRLEIFPPYVIRLKPISIMEEDDEVLMESSKGDLILYIPEQDICRIVLNTPARNAQVVMYVETLVLPVIGSG